MTIKLATSSELLTLTQLTKLHDSNLNVCSADTRFNISTVDSRAKVHSRRKLELNKDDLLEFFNHKGYATYQVAFNRQNQPVRHLMPYNKNQATDFANLLKAQLTKYIKTQYPHNAGIVFHFDEATPNAHVFFRDYDSNSTTQSYQPHLKSNTNNDDNKQQTQEADSKQQAKAKQQQEQLLQQQLRQRQTQIAVQNVEAEKKKQEKLKKQRQTRIQQRKRRLQQRKQQDDLEP